MPRKAFVADLQEATKVFERVNVSRLRAGEEDGMINFHYHVGDGEATEITIMVPGKWPLICMGSGDIESQLSELMRITRKLSDKVY